MPATAPLRGKPLATRPGMFRARTPLAATVAAATMALGAHVASAQSVAQAVVHDFKYGFADIWHVWTSPAHASARDWRDAGLVIAAAGLAATADRGVDRFVVEHPRSFPVRVTQPFRERRGYKPADLGTARILLPLSGAVYVTGVASGSRALRDAGMGCAASQQANSVVRHLTYEVVDRERPSLPGSDPYRIRFPGGDWNHHSFFAGHVANAVACASYASTRFELGVVEPLLYAGAAGIGLARIADRRHWLSDTVLGVAFGYATGRSVALRQKKRLARESSAGAEPRAHFYTTASTVGLTLGWTATF